MIVWCRFCRWLLAVKRQKNREWPSFSAKLSIFQTIIVTGGPGLTQNPLKPDLCWQSDDWFHFYIYGTQVMP
jgi:hypothetical protein